MSSASRKSRRSASSAISPCPRSRTMETREIVGFLGPNGAGNAIALVMDPNAFAPVMSTAVVPLVLLSGAFLPMSMAPGWLDALSRLTPFRYVLEAIRELFVGHYATMTVVVGVAVTAVLSVVCVSVGTRVFNRENA
ncbi:ABC transporter permease [Streptosporangium sp. NPDC001681]|uniref:ABC transporter permease n=1 Tax=Streptosporangium sp. NPDC001681 TaxID=3154395 RepID=UPI0033181F57